MIDISNNEKTVDLINVIIVKPGYQQHIIDNVRDILNQIAKNVLDLYLPQFIRVWMALRLYISSGGEIQTMVWRGLKL